MKDKHELNDEDLVKVTGGANNGKEKTNCRYFLKKIAGTSNANRCGNCIYAKVVDGAYQCTGPCGQIGKSGVI